MQDPGITRLDIDHYRRTLKLTLSDTVRQETQALLDEAEQRLRNEPPRQPNTDQDQ